MADLGRQPPPDARILGLKSEKTVRKQQDGLIKPVAKVFCKRGVSYLLLPNAALDFTQGDDTQEKVRQPCHVTRLPLGGRGQDDARLR